MRITCLTCHAEASLDALIGREVDARAVSQLLERYLVLGDAVIRYIALFRPEKRRLGLGRMVSLVDELMPDIERQAITRKGREWAAPHAVWRAAIDQVMANRAKGSITLPLTGHGYLYEVIMGLADKAEALVERDREAANRGRAHIAGPVAAAALLPGANAPTSAPLPPPVKPNAEQLAALKKAREGAVLPAPVRRPISTTGDEATP